MQFTINISIDSTGVSQIYGASQSVTLVRSVDSFVRSAPALSMAAALPYSVVWLAFQPFQSNCITWSDACELIASTTPAQAGNVITASATTSGAQPGETWTLQNGQFSLTSSGGGSGYLAANEQTNGLTFGLLASATVNGAQVVAPLNVQPVLYNQLGEFTPGETISVFLSSAGASGTIVPDIAGAGLTVSLTPASPVVNLGFNDETNQFYVSG